MKMGFLGLQITSREFLVISNPKCGTHDDLGNCIRFCSITGFQITNSVLISGFEKPSIR